MSAPELAAVKERPILFSAPMVRAIIAGDKTQTRRRAKMNTAGRVQRGGRQWHVDDPAAVLGCPYGVVGDRLWLKETHQYVDWTEDGMPWVRYAADGHMHFHDSGMICDEWGERLNDIWEGLSDPANVAIDGKAADRKWRPSIFMPRWASRITLEITDVRVQRLWDITEADALAEGVYHDGQWFRGGTHPIKGSDQCWPTAWAAFRAVWDTINGAGSWDASPWVWALSFRRVHS